MKKYIFLFILILVNFSCDNSIETDCECANVNGYMVERCYGLHEIYENMENLPDEVLREIQEESTICNGYTKTKI